MCEWNYPRIIADNAISDWHSYSEYIDILEWQWNEVLIPYWKETAKLAKEIGIKNVELVHARAEDLAKKKEYREQYDVCVSRAVANLATLSEYCIPFVKIGGYFAPYKTAAAEEEIAEGKKALFILGGHLESVSEFSDAELDHTILWIKKVKMTPVKYPRKAGTPSKEPLK